MNIEKEKRPPWWILAASGISSGIITAFFTAPLDLIRTKQMASEKSISAFSILSDCFRAEKSVRLFRGMGSMFLGVTLAWTIYWISYTSSKNSLSDLLGDLNSPFVHVTSALIGGTLTAIMTNPVWVVKTQIQAGCEPIGKIPTSFFEGLKVIFRKNGIIGLYRGLVPSLLGVVHVCIQFPLYERAKLHFAKKSKNQLSLSSNNINNVNTNNKLTFKEIIICSVFAKTIASIVAYPHEVLRVRQQVETKSFDLLSIFKSIYKEAGFLGFYRGISTSLCRTIPSCIITFLSFESLQKVLMDFYTKSDDHIMIQEKKQKLQERQQQSQQQRKQ